MANPDQSPLPPLIPNVPPLPPKFAYWTPLEEDATLWVTLRADREAALIPRGAVYDNPTAKLFAVDPDEMDRPFVAEPKVNIVVADDSESREVLGLDTVGSSFAEFEDFGSEGVIHPQRVDVIIRSPETVLTTPGLLQAYLDALNKRIYRRSWTEQFLQTNPEAPDASSLLAHILVDTALASTTNTLTAHAATRLDTPGYSPSVLQVHTERMRALERSKKICESLHRVFCRGQHPAADIV